MTHISEPTKIKYTGVRPCMKRTLTLSLALLPLALSSTSTMFAATLNGVTLPDTSHVGGQLLLLNGLGERSEYMVKVYVAGLYLPNKSSDAVSIVQANSPKRIVLQFQHAASQKQLSDAFQESIKDNAPSVSTATKVDIDRILGVMESVKPGDQMAFTYLPATGTTVSINGTDKMTIAGAPCAQALFSMWLGPKPPTSGLKKGLLGQ